MIIGVDASRAFLKRRTGIEEYSYQVIKHLRGVIPNEDHVVLYVRKKFVLSFVIPAKAGIYVSHALNAKIPGQARNDKKKQSFFSIPDIDFDLPKNWEVKGLWAPRFWTQIRLSLEMLFHPPDVLLVPAHTIPIVHPEKTIVTVHGLEYEIFPETYSLWARLYMRFSIRFSVRVASQIVAVSENTKRDLMRLYRVPEEKISVVYEGVFSNLESRILNLESDFRPSFQLPASSFLLFIGRLEERKNIIRIIEAFEILKEKYGIPHELVLAGKPGFGYERIFSKIQDSRFKIQIREPGYVSEEEKIELLRHASIFLFPTLYEGFGLPVLEAQAAGVPVVTSNSSSLPEVGGEGALYADPLSSEDIVEQTWKLLSEKSLRDGIIAAGRENAGRFSWGKCAQSIASLSCS